MVLGLILLNLMYCSTDERNYRYIIKKSVDATTGTFYETSYRDSSGFLLLDGLSKEYSKDSILLAEVPYHLGKQDGVARYYHPSGVISMIKFYNHGKGIEYELSFNEDGSLKYYASIDEDERIRFLVYYKEGLNSIDSVDGKFFYLMSTKPDSLNNINHYIHSAYPPNTKIEFKIYLMDTLYTIYQNDKRKVGEYVKHPFFQLKKGSGKVTIVGKLLDGKSNAIIKTDTIHKHN